MKRSRNLPTRKGEPGWDDDSEARLTEEEMKAVLAEILPSAAWVYVEDSERVKW